MSSYCVIGFKTIATCLLACFSLAANPAQIQRIQQKDLPGAIDTTAIKKLFEQGRRFFDGPSDSLIFYFNAGLSIVLDNYEKLPDQQKNISFPAYRLLKQLEQQANIQLGIENLLQGNYNTSLDFYFHALDISRELGDISAMSECYGEIGTLYNNQGKYKLALDYQLKALTIAVEMDDQDWIAICNNNIGNVYKKKSFYSLALKHFLDALEWFEKSGQQRRIAACYQNIGDVYFAQKSYDKALEYYEKTSKIAVACENHQREADSYLLIGLVKSARQNHKRAREYLDKALGMYKNLGYKHGMDDCYIALGDTWIGEGNFNRAEECFDKALKIAGSGDDKASMAEASNKLGFVFLNQKLYDQSANMLNNGLQLAIEIGSKELQTEANKLLAQLYEEVNKPELALKHYTTYAALKDSLFSDAQYRIITEMEMVYNAAKKEQNIVLLNEKTRVQELVISRRNRLILAFGLFFIISLITGYLYISNTKLKSRQQSVDLENRLLRSQMNPHFIFNSLIAIQSYFYENNPVKAGDFLAKFAELIRITLENSRVEFVLFEKELAMISIYLELQALRFNNKFNSEIAVDEDIDPASIRIPPMLAQPFIENAIEHGLRNINGQGQLSIGFSKNGKTLMVSVQDNGIGREAARHYRKSAEHLSLAVPMIKERLEMMSKKFRQRFGVEITDLYEPDGKPSGTRVEITMPWQS